MVNLLHEGRVLRLRTSVSVWHPQRMTLKKTTFNAVYHWTLNLPYQSPICAFDGPARRPMRNRRWKKGCRPNKNSGCRTSQVHAYRRLYQPRPALFKAETGISDRNTPTNRSENGDIQRAKPFQSVLERAILAPKKSTVIRVESTHYLSAQQRSSS